MATNRFDQLISAWEPQLQRAFLESIYNLRDTAHLDQIIKMLENGDVDGALRAVGIDPVSFRPFDKSIANAFEAGGEATATALPATTAADGFRTVFQFAVRNPEAEIWLKSYSGDLIKAIVDDQKTAVRNFLSAGLEAGANPRTTALDLVGRISKTSGQREGGVIGLTSSQEEWVRNYRDELTSDNPASALERALRDARFDRAVLKASDSGEPIPADLVNKMVTAYKNRALRYRAETIARKETITALHTAQEMAMQQAIGKGVIDKTTVTYIWRTAHDKRVRQTHRSMDGQVRKEGQPFVTGGGAHLLYPGDPAGPAGETINCFHPSTLIDVAGLKGVIAREYRGELVKLSVAADVDLSVTPNHPVLTERGWVAAGQLVKGDYLINRSITKSASVSKPEMEQGHATAKSLCDLAKFSGRIDWAVKSSVNLHGEVPDHDIEVITFPSKLRHAFKSSGLKRFSYFGFQHADILEGVLLADRLCGEVLFAPNGARSRIVSIKCKLTALLRRHFGKPEQIGLAATSMLKAEIVNAGVYRASANANEFGHLLYGRAALVELLDAIKDAASKFCSGSLPRLTLLLSDLLFGQFRQTEFAKTSGDLEVTNSKRAAHFGSGHAKRMQACDFGINEGTLFRPVRLVGVDRVHYAGPVYNFETDNGLILASGIVTHNCRCFREPRVDFLAGIK